MDKKVAIVIVIAVVAIVAIAAAVVLLNNTNNEEAKKLTIYVEDSTNDFHTNFVGVGDTKLDAAKDGFKKADIEYIVKDNGWVEKIRGKGLVEGEGTYTYWILFNWNDTTRQWVLSDATVANIDASVKTICYYYGTVDENFQPLSYPKYSPGGLVYDDTLLVYGNANNDNTINAADKAIIQDIIDGKKKLSDYPLADANVDKVVDSKDLALVDKIINRESTDIYVKSQLDADDKTNAGDLNFEYAKITYPLKNVVVINADLIMTMVVLDGKKVMAGYGGSTYGLEKQYVSGLTDVKASRLVDETAYKNIKNLDSQLESQGGIGSLILYNVNSVTSKGYADDLMDAGIPMIVLKCSMPDLVGNSLVTLGFLFGGDYEKRGTDISDFVKSEYEYISKTLGSEELPTVSALSMGVSLAESSSQYMKAAKMGGALGKYLKEGTGSTSMSGPEVLLSLDPTALLSFTTKGLLKLDDANVIKTYECSNFSYITPCNAYKNGNLSYINASLPAMIRVAYAAQALHPELFKGYGDTVFQELVDKFMPYLNDLCDDGDFDVKQDCTCLITYQDYKNAGGTK